MFHQTFLLSTNINYRFDSPLMKIHWGFLIGYFTWRISSDLFFTSYVNVTVSDFQNFDISGRRLRLHKISAMAQQREWFTPAVFFPIHCQMEASKYPNWPLIELLWTIKQLCIIQVFQKQFLHVLLFFWLNNTDSFTWFYVYFCINQLE